MSIQLIQQYYSKIDQIKRYGGSINEQSLRKAFQDLLEHYASSKKLMVIAEVDLRTKKGTTIRPDGVLKDALRMDWGYWESKDEKDDLEAEIKTKFHKGYPDFNTLFEDTHTAILYQGGLRVLEASFDQPEDLHKLLTLFVNYEPAEVREFHKAIKQFSEEIGGLATALREVIEEQVSTNMAFSTAMDEFLELCKKSINPKIEMADLREMVIQHVLTEDIFMRVFDEAEFHRDNVIAHKLTEVAGTFYHGDTKRNILARIKPYYETINARAASISDHHEKQKFLKALYESFYRAYNPKAADRLGIIYTPDEIVRFMIESADYLTNKHFGKSLGDKGVEILDPATGTGTFITELIEYLPPNQLEYKYEHEIHCNEVAILPYYIANLNIEYTYKQKTGKYKEFENICFVDTLDNMGFLYPNKQTSYLTISDENSERITRQNSKPIMVVIGNPPYNANQANENENNKNREYPQIDKRIKDTYIKYSNAQKTKMYDMYSRFYRWASDRLDKTGIIAFITNSSFLDSRTFDGFRKVVADEFSHIYIVDLGGNVRNNPKLSGTTNNVFGIQTGVCITFLVKTAKKSTPTRINYIRRPEFEIASDKLDYLNSSTLSILEFQTLHPDKNHNWLNQTENDWNDLIPVVSKQAKFGKTDNEQKAIIKQFSLGVASNRDEWVHDDTEEKLSNKVKFFIDTYNNEVDKFGGKIARNDVEKVVTNSIKWTRAVKNDLTKGKRYVFDKNNIIESIYRPYDKRKFYFSAELNEMRNLMPRFFMGGNFTIMISGSNSPKPFTVLATDLVPDLNSLSAAADGCRVLPFYDYGITGDQYENITSWSVAQFQKKFDDKNITKIDIFHYVYAVLHNPAYRRKYEQNLKREFPRIPFYDDFHQWAAWGAKLMDLHINYEQVEPYPLERIDLDEEINCKGIITKLRPRKDLGMIEVDSITTLKGIPAEAWEYQLGTYSALGWVLERYKEKKPKDPTIAEKFNTYKFADYKEYVIDLLGRVCRVSVETMKIIGEMEG